MSRAIWIFLCLIIINFLFLISPVKIFAKEASVIEIKMLNHIQMGLPEQDVFIESTDNLQQVIRVEGMLATSSANLSKPVFASTNAIEHDPFKVEANSTGPFPKGKNLGFTLGKWLDAKGSGTYQIDDENTQLNLNFENLISNSTYSLWCSEMTMPPNFKVEDKPCGKTDGSENLFKSDDTGGGSIDIKMQPLIESTEEMKTIITLVYHNDGKTHADKPGEFGLNSHVQLAYIVNPSQVEAVGDVAVPAPKGGSKIRWIVYIGIGILIIWLIWKKSSDSSEKSG